MTEIKWAQAADHLPLEAIRPNPRNPKKHTKAQLAHIRESILRFGFLDPIGVWGEEHIVVEGHGRLEALRQMAAAQEIRLPDEGIPCIRLDHLSKRDRDAYMLEHNQATMETGWDDDALDELLGDLAQDGLDMSAFGFDVPGALDEQDGKYTWDVHIPQYPEKSFGDDKTLRVFISTQTELSAQEILNIYANRWSIEVFFRSCKQKLAFDKCQLRKKKGIMRMWLILSFVHFLCCTVVGHIGHLMKDFIISEILFCRRLLLKVLFHFNKVILCIFRDLLIYSFKEISENMETFCIFSGD